MNIQLVDNARDWWKMYSNWVFMFISVMGTVQIFLPFVSWALPNWLLGFATLCVGLAGVAARLIKQFNLQPVAKGV